MNLITVSGTHYRLITIVLLRTESIIILLIS